MGQRPDRFVRVHTLVADDDVCLASGDDGCFVHPCGAAVGFSPLGLEPVRDPADDDDLKSVFREGRVRVELFHVVAVEHRGLAEGPVVGLDVLIFLLTIVGGRDAQGLGQYAMARTDLDGTVPGEARSQEVHQF